MAARAPQGGRPASRTRLGRWRIPPADKADPLAGYRPLEDTYDEFFDGEGRPHPALAGVVEPLRHISRVEYRRRQKISGDAFLRGGVTFSVYAHGDGDPDRIFPFDLIPRVIARSEWNTVERGLVQRIAALNAFLGDLYGAQRILSEGVVPREMVESSRAWLPSLRGLRPPGGVYIHIAGADLVRGSDGRFLVLEDNIRTPSGVSYVLENRMVMRRVLPEVAAGRVALIDDYPARLREAMAAVAPCGGGEPRAVVLTPGALNSAYFEHSFLARRMGCELVRGDDLFVERDRRTFYEHLVKSTVLFHGVVYGTMLHDEPLSFMKLGRAVERAGQTAGIVDAHSQDEPGQAGAAAGAARWLTILRCCCAFDPFFRRVAHPLSRKAVVRFLLFDRAFPRSVLYNLDEARTLLFMLRRDDPVGLPRRSRTVLERLRGELLQTDVTDVERRGLHVTLSWIVEATDRLCDAIHDDYLDPQMEWLRHCVRVLESVDPAPESWRAA